MNDHLENVAPGTEGRWNALRHLEEWLETPMLVLSFTWLALVVAELVWGETQIFEVFGSAIWVIFLLEFVVRLALAPGKVEFLKGNWLTAMALVAPAFRLLRVFRLLRLARAARGLRLLRIVGTANRGMNAMRTSFSRRGLGYVLASTVLVTLLGAGGMLAFEPATEIEGGFTSYADALWWTAMLISSIGSNFWPVSAEGRILCFLVSIYGFAVFGYLTASFASFFVERDAAAPEGDTPRRSDLVALHAEIKALRIAMGDSV